jgi:hypothetical protein
VPTADVGKAAIDLLRAAYQDGATLTHALSIGRSRSRDDPANDSHRRGVRLLEAVIAFLGSKPRAGEIGSSATGGWMESLDHGPGTCRPSCSPRCYRAKLRSVALTLPDSFRAAR